MHSGGIIGKKDQFNIINCEKCGFAHIDPLPSDNEIIQYYSEKYFNQIRSGEKGRNLKHYLNGGEEARAESEWMRVTEHNDISAVFLKYLKGESRRLCDVGCGSGVFLKNMVQNGWKGIGVEPSSNAGCNNTEIVIFNNSLSGFLAENPENEQSFDAVTLLGVLEHATNPQQMLEETRRLLKPDGIMCIKVPNDFSEIQKAALSRLAIEPWWISVPDHINYFSAKSLENLLSKVGFSVIHKTTDFPMEFFLLMGENYVASAELGSSCHQQRRSFELALPSELRTSLYSCFVDMGIGRNLLFYAQFRG